MGLRDQISLVVAAFQEQKCMLQSNETLMKIHEGELLQFIEAELQKELSANAFAQAQSRIPPINIERRVVDKLSQIYAKPPTRKLGKSATQTDSETWTKYLESMGLDVSGQTLNEYFNLMKSCAWQPYLDEQFEPRVRELPKDRFFVMGLDPAQPLRVTHFVLVMGRKVVEKSKDGATVSEDVAILHVYTDTEFLIVLDNGDVDTEEMLRRGLNGQNPYGKIPFVYLNRSKTSINAPSDTDMYRMTTLIPILFADVNYALKFQAFSIWWGVNVDTEKLPIAPNAFVNLKADPNNPGVTPSLNTIKPDVDSDKALAAIMEQISLWLQSKGIRPGALGKMSSENMVSGISKIVDEMDTSGDRQKQIPFFVEAEQQLFRLIAYTMHPVWQKQPSFKIKASFSKDLPYAVKFPEQISWQTRKELLDEVGKEMDLGLMSKETAFRKVNPEMSPEEAAAELAKIKADEDAQAAKDAKNNAGGFPNV